MAKSKKPGSGDSGTAGDDGYDVGYGKPPKANQFKKGQSGNPGGRKRESVNISTILEEVLGHAIEISENGKKQLVSIQKALILRWVQEGLKGNVRAIEGVYDRRQRIELASVASELDHDAADDALLESYVHAQVEAAIAKLRREWASATAQPQTQGDEDA